jgi:hypothetical protein
MVQYHLILLIDQSYIATCIHGCVGPSILDGSTSVNCVLHHAVSFNKEGDLPLVGYI